MPRKNKELERAYLKKYRQGSKFREYQKKYRREHPEKFVSAARKRHHEWWIANRESDLHVRRSLYRRAKKRAAYLKVPFTITLDDIQVPKNCPIFGFPLKVNVGRYGDDSPSLDRIIPKLGYVPGNVIVISQRANVLKRDASLEELEALVRGLRRITKSVEDNDIIPIEGVDFVMSTNVPLVSGLPVSGKSSWATYITADEMIPEKAGLPAAKSAEVNPL